MEKTIKILSTEALRDKPLSAVDKYLKICADNSISVGLYCKGSLYVLSSCDNTLNLQYGIGSVSKTITAHLILSLSENGLIKLNNSVSEYISLPNGEYPTVYELLTHTAGYRHITPIEITVPSFLRHICTGKNIYGGCDRNSVLKCLSNRNKRIRRSGKYGYSDFAYAVLALVAESVTKQSFASLLESFVYNNLGLTNTAVNETELTKQPNSCNREQNIRSWKWKRENPYIAGGGLSSTVSDMLKYLALQIESSEPFIEKAHRLCPATVSNKSDTACCIGWHTYKNSNKLWHVGAVGPFHSSLIFNKRRKIGVSVLGNSKGTRSANVNHIANMLYSELRINKIDFSRIVL